MSEPAPLVEIPDAPAPPGGAAEWFRGLGGAKLRGGLFTPEGVSRGSVVLSGGRTEPIEKYFEVIGELLHRGFTVLAHDWRGQGLSQRELADPEKGHAQGDETYLADFRLMLDAFEARAPKPWIALGHSMGGCLSLLALAKGASPRFAAAVLSAPMLGLHLPIPAGVARGLATAFVRLGLARAYSRRGRGAREDLFEGNLLTHDEVRFRRHRRQLAARPELALGGPTWGWLDFAMRAGAYLARSENLKSVRIPVLIVSAGADLIVLERAQRKAAQALADGRFVSIPGASHEILMETDDKRAVFWQAFDALADQAAPLRTAPIEFRPPSA